MILKDQENLVSKVLPIPAVHDAFSLYEPCYALEKKTTTITWVVFPIPGGSESSENYQPILIFSSGFRLSTTCSDFPMAWGDHKP